MKYSKVSKPALSTVIGEGTCKPIDLKHEAFGYTEAHKSRSAPAMLANSSLPGCCMDGGKDIDNRDGRTRKNSARIRLADGN